MGAGEEYGCVLSSVLFADDCGHDCEELVTEALRSFDNGRRISYRGAEHQSIKVGPLPFTAMMLMRADRSLPTGDGWVSAFSRRIWSPRRCHPSGGDRGQQCVLICKVAVGRTSAHTGLSTHFPQGHRGGAAVVEKTCRAIEQSAACSSGVFGATPNRPS
jgi:hypothetical protein